MKKLISQLSAATATFLIIASILTHFLLTQDSPTDYQVFGGTVAIATLVLCGALGAYLLVWVIRNPQEATETISA